MQEEEKENTVEKKMQMKRLHSKVEKELNHKICSTDFEMINIDKG
jgi:hypothetical protein